MKTIEFDYDLPAELIAQTPVEPRDSARLMVLDRKSGALHHRVFRDIGDLLNPGDMLVLNNTRVLPARLLGRKRGTGGRVELLLLEQRGQARWLALVGGRRVRIGTVVELLDRAGRASGIRGEVLAAFPDGQREVEFNQPADEWLSQLGHAPLPPYIHNYAGDPERYQTVYARRDGSAAAPTAGLHFTPELLLALRDRGIKIGYVTLHIGLDTFRPITVDELSLHPMHSEWASLDLGTARQINDTRLSGGRIVAVGSTAVRTLETAARAQNSSECREDVCGWSSASAFEGPTDLFIAPGHRFRAVDAMVSNFHLPKSTLIVMVAAFAGLEMIQQAYGEAMAHNYRFYSFGDAMLLL